MSFYLCPLCDKNEDSGFSSMKTLERHIDDVHLLFRPDKYPPRNIKNPELIRDPELVRLEEQLNGMLEKLHDSIRTTADPILLPILEPLEDTDYMRERKREADRKLRETEYLRDKCMNLEEKLFNVQLEKKEMEFDRGYLQKRFHQLSNYLKSMKSQQLKGRMQLENFIDSILEEKESPVAPPRRTLEQRDTNPYEQPINTKKAGLIKRNSVNDSGYFEPVVIETDLESRNQQDIHQLHVPRITRVSELSPASFASTKTYASIASLTHVDISESGTKTYEIDSWPIIFKYLDAEDLIRLSWTSTKFKSLIDEPKVWKEVSHGQRKTSNEFLTDLAARCSESEAIFLNFLSGADKMMEDKSTRTDASQEINFGNLHIFSGALEHGFEELLKAASHHLNTVNIANCDPVLTDRALWLSGKYSKNLTSLVYVSKRHPLTAGVIWAMSSGGIQLKNLSLLHSAEPQPTDVPRLRLDDNALKMIASCWGKSLERLTIGGNDFTIQGVERIVTRCQSLLSFDLTKAAIYLTKEELKTLMKAATSKTMVMRFNKEQLSPDAQKIADPGRIILA